MPGVGTGMDTGRSRSMGTVIVRRTVMVAGTVMVAAVALVLGMAGCVPASDGASPTSPPATAVPGSPPMTDGAVPGSPGQPAARAGTRWAPAPGDSWQWQLSGSLDLDVDVPVYDVDFETTSAADVAVLNQQDRGVICYLSVGSWEDFRGDADTFPEIVLGKEMSGWPDERWLDIRRLDLLLPIMAARMDTCVAKGFDAVEPDNVDGYRNDSGFPLTSENQLAYNRAVAELAHERGLSVGLKNDLDQIPQLAGDFDFAVNEECVLYKECGRYAPFTLAGKAVLHVEYEGELDFCDESARLGLSSMIKPLDLGAARQAC